MLVNLFDFNFRQSACSVAYQTPQHIQYVRDQYEFDGVTLFTDAYCFGPEVDKVKSRYKVAWLHEPRCLWPHHYENILYQHSRGKFDLILTYDQSLLQYPGFRFCPYGGTWIDKRDWGIKPKTKLCSMLIGSKMSTRGHQIRHEIADIIEREGYPVDFYGVRGEPVGYGQDTKLKVLSDYCFSIVTETCREDNLFTEWLLDCFAVGTIPIFWGCPNIDQFFDGVWDFDNPDQLRNYLEHATGFTYSIITGHTRTNLEKMQQYAVTEDWLYLNVLKEFE